MRLVMALVVALGGLGLVAGPFVVGAAFPVPLVLAQALGAMALLLAVVLFWSNFIVRVGPGWALVRHGQGGTQCFMGGAVVVLPVIHSTTQISLAPIRLLVERRSEDALFAKDNVRVDVGVEFEFEVPPTAEAVLAAVRSLGVRGTQPDLVSALVFEKLVSAVRSAAAALCFDRLLADRDELARAARRGFGAEAEPGLVLCRAQVVYLDLPDAAALKPGPLNQKTLDLLAYRERAGNLPYPPNATG